MSLAQNPHVFLRKLRRTYSRGTSPSYILHPGPPIPIPRDSFHVGPRIGFPSDLQKGWEHRCSYVDTSQKKLLDESKNHDNTEKIWLGDTNYGREGKFKAG